MRACVFALAASLCASISQAAPVRAASLNLCTDELVLLIAAPPQIASVTHLARNRHESPLWRTARRFPANDGSIVSVAGMRPDVIVTMGGMARDQEQLAGRIGARLISLDYPQSLDDIAAGTMEIARALDRESRGRRIVRALRRLQRSTPSESREGAFLSGGGLTHYEGSLGAAWLALAGLVPPEGLGAQISAERILTNPPPIIVRSNYRQDQASRDNHWIGYRFLERASATRTIRTDGRLWTCAGPLLIAEVARLRREIWR